MNDMTMPFVLEPALLESARALSMQCDMPLVQALGEVSGGTSEALMAGLAANFGYPLLSMADLQSLEPDFDLIGYTECTQRSVLVARDGGGELMLVVADPFDGLTEDWALRRCGGRAWVCLAHPEDMLAYFAQQER